MDIYEQAQVRYDDVGGTVAADARDMADLGGILGVDHHLWWTVAAFVRFSEGVHSIRAFGVPLAVGRAELEAAAASGEAVPLTVVAESTWIDEDQDDTNPPSPAQVPVVSAWEYVSHAFKRLEIRFVDRSLPAGVVFEVVGE